MRTATDPETLLKQAPLLVVAERIKEARRQADLSHDKLGAAIGGVTRQHLIKLEKGTHRPRLDMLTRIAEATGKPVEWFLGASEVTPRSEFRGQH